MAANNYEIDYNDDRFTQVEEQKQQALTEAENTYAGMIDQTDKYYQDQINASKEWADKQQQIQQDNTDFTIEQIEQQKQQANKDYLKEQSGAYTDYQKQSNKYGVNAEQMAAGGLSNTGFSESSQVSMYNTYQNRVAASRESYNQAVLNYNNAIKDAQLQNNSALAEIAYNALQQQLELALQGFQYHNQLVMEQANKKQELDNEYYNRYQNVLNQINQENAFAEQIRQYEQNYALQVKEYEESIRQFNEEMARLKKKDEEEYALEIQQLELKKQQLEEEKAQAEKEYQLKKAQLEQKQQGLSSGSSSINKTSTASGSGTFSGSQPNSINGYGKVSKSGDTVVVGDTELPIYKTSDGSMWYWSSGEGKYKFIGKAQGAKTLDEYLTTSSTQKVSKPAFMNSTYLSGRPNLVSTTPTGKINRNSVGFAKVFD